MLDIKKEFYSVSHKSIERALRRLGFDENTIEYVMGVLRTATTTNRRSQTRRPT